MREIKFRAWDKSKNKWLRDIIINQHGTVFEFVYGEEPGDGDYKETNNVILCQFTGLKDKNGKDIYEGDIIRTGTDKLMVITWSDKFASFCIYREGWAFQHWFGEACNPEDCTIEGNIYENTDLL